MTNRSLGALPSTSPSAAALPPQRHLFEIPKTVCYLNCAYISPLLRSVREAGEAAVRRKSEPWKIRPPDFFAETRIARARFAALIDATPDDIALIPSASYGVATAARALTVGRGEKILVLEEEFPSNYYPWRRLADETGAAITAVSRPADGDWTAAVLSALDAATRIVALPHCHWTDGGLVDLVAVGAACRRIGAALVIDATQSLGAMPLSIRAIDPDFVVAASYKWLLGPYSHGFLYAAPRRHGARPLEESWCARAGSEDFASLVRYRSEYQPGARRFDMGEPSNPILLPMVIRALEQILTWTVPAIAETLGRINRALAARVAELGFLAPPERYRAPHLLGLTIPAHAPPDLVSALAAEDIHVSVRGRSMRIAPHVYVTDADVERLVRGLARVVA